MKKVLIVVVSLVMVLPLYSEDASGLRVNGGVKTGLMIQNRDFGGHLGNLALGGHKYPMTLYFASFENQSRIGEAWMNLGYSWNIDRIGSFGLQMGFWAHGNLNSFQDAVRIGDMYVWANFLDERLQFIGGRGGGAPINSGGWINADWLSYAGLRFFWVSPSGLSVGLKFPDPGEDGIKPVNYLSLLGAGASFRNNNWWISFQFDNSPIYDDSQANYYGGLKRPAEQDPIALAGNIAFGMGMDNVYGGRGFVVLEGLFTNLGENHLEGMGNYTYSPVHTSFALKTGLPITDNMYAEVKGRYTIRQGDNEIFSGAVSWGKLEVEPYISFQALDHLRFHFAFYSVLYINSYYLALDASPQMFRFNAGQVPGYPPLLDYLSQYQFTFKPGISITLQGITIDFGYNGSLSRDFIENTMYIDFRWTF